MIQYKLDQNERSENPPNWAIQALSSLPMDTLWRYQDRTNFERQLAETWNLTQEQVLITNGGDEGIQYLFASLKPNTPVILPLPIFGFYREQSEIWQVKPIFIPPNPNLTLEIDALNQAVESNPQALCIVTRPNNPTGEVLTRETMEGLLQACKRQETTLLLDEAYADFFADPLLSLIETYPNLIILRTFSKAMGLAGLRLGVLVGQAQLMRPLKQRALPYNITAPSLVIGQAALEPQARQEIADYATTVAGNVQILLRRLRDWGIATTQSKANFVLLRLSVIKAGFVFDALTQMGIAIRRFSQPELTGCLRIAVPAECTALMTALEKVLNPKLLCLDVDGTLLNTEASFDALVIQLVERYCGQTPTAEDILATRAKGGFNDDFALVSELCRLRGKTIGYDQVAKDGHTLYFGTKEKPGLHRLETPIYQSALLEKLQKNRRIALVTGRSREELATAQTLLAELNQPVCITIDDVTLGKPDPEGIQLARKLTDENEAWMVGDNPDDMAAGVAAGAIGIGVGSNKSALLKAGAVVVLDTINELEALL